MGSLKLTSKPHLISIVNIDKYVKKNKIGNYALGYMKNGLFTPKYIGRSDNGLNKRLKNYTDTKYNRFKFMYQTSKRNAFIKECENYHDFIKQLDNKIHPRKPDNANWFCPRKCKEHY